MNHKGEIQAYKKIDESKFFLEKMKETEDEKDYFFSAFSHAWRSVLDYLLYDFAIYYDLGFSREEYMRPWQFRWAAQRLDDKKALKFYDWWNKKIENLKKSLTWEMRDKFTHRGYEYGDEFVSSPVEYFTSYLSINGGYHYLDFLEDAVDLSGEYVDYPSLVLICEKALKEMEKILDEAESFLNSDAI